MSHEMHEYYIHHRINHKSIQSHKSVITHWAFRFICPKLPIWQLYVSCEISSNRHNNWLSVVVMSVSYGSSQSLTVISIDQTRQFCFKFPSNCSHVFTYPLGFIFMIHKALGYVPFFTFNLVPPWQWLHWGLVDDPISNSWCCYTKSEN